MKSLKLLTLLFICLLFFFVEAKAAGRGMKAGGASGAASRVGSGLESKMTRPEKPQNNFKDAVNIEKPEELKNTITGGPGEISGKNSGLKENLPQTAEKNNELKDRAAAAKENLSMQKSEYAAKADELRLKISEKKTGEQKSNFEKLASDINSIKSGSEVTPEMKEKLSQDLKSTLSTADMPSAESLESFCDTLAGAVSDQKITPAEAVKLAGDAEAILNSANISTEDAEILVNDATAIIEAADISDEEKQALKGDIESIAAVSKLNAESAKEAATQMKSEGAKLETFESGDKEAVQERMKETKEKIEEIKRQKNGVRERIKDIKKNR